MANNRVLPPAAGMGRKKGVPNKTTALLKDAILRAAEAAGGGGSEGLVQYLTIQASENPGPFMSLLGKVLPMQIEGNEDNPVSIVTRIELVAPIAQERTPARRTVEDYAKMRAYI